jgi:hypothetical protein
MAPSLPRLLRGFAARNDRKKLALNTQLTIGRSQLKIRLPKGAVFF